MTVQTEKKTVTFFEQTGSGIEAIKSTLINQLMKDKATC